MEKVCLVITDRHIQWGTHITSNLFVREYNHRSNVSFARNMGREPKIERGLVMSIFKAFFRPNPSRFLAISQRFIFAKFLLKGNFCFMLEF